jgi:16S rRNA (uracil1498-N3)-methyltransferase
MPVERFYIEDPLQQKSFISLEQEEFHHLAHVLRMRAGEEITLVNGKGSLAKAVLTSIEKNKAIAHIQSTEKHIDSFPPLILSQAITRPARLEYIVEKSVELGATQIRIFPGKLSEKKEIFPSLEKRLQSIVISAVKQCGRLFLPELILAPPLFSWKQTDLVAPAFFGDTDPNAPPFFSFLSDIGSCQIFIGPEQGFHPEETLFLQNTLGAQGVCLHKNILRTDTAAICALSIASSLIRKI